MPDNEETTRIPDGTDETTRVPDGTGETTRVPDGTERTTVLPEEGAEQTTWFGQWDRSDQSGRADRTDVDEPEEQGRRGTHPLQTGYLVIGLLAVGVALMWLLTDRGVIEGGDGGVVFSVVLITAGAVGLAASLGKGLRRG